MKIDLIMEDLQAQSFNLNQLIFRIFCCSVDSFYLFKNLSAQTPNNIIESPNFMAQIQNIDYEKRDHLCGAMSNTGSPYSLSVTLSPSQAFNCTSPGRISKFEIGDQIQSNSHQEDERNQEKKHWNCDQQGLLLKLHDQLGNKWTDIANELSGRQGNTQVRDHNAVKNHFYAKIRKSLRRINHFIKLNFNKQLKQLNMSHVSKMITLLSEKKPNEIVFEANEQQIQEIKRFLFSMGDRQEKQKLDGSTLKAIKRHVEKICELLDSVKKNNFIIKSKGKRKEKVSEVKSNLIRQSSTVRVSPKEEKPQQVQQTQERSPSFLGFEPEKASNNFMMMFLPYQMQSEYTPIMSPNYQYNWVNPMQPFIYFGSNIYGNS